MSFTYLNELLVKFATLMVVAAAVAGAQAQTFSVVYNFGSVANDPVNPFAQGVIAQGRDGALYSTTPYGFNNTGYGPMFKITSSGVLTEPYNFDSTTGPSFSGLTLATDGNFYGTAGTSADGTVFQLTPAGILAPLHTFNGTDGAGPLAPPIQGTDGNLYGTVTQGGDSSSCGLVYKVTLSGIYTLLYQFDGTHGCAPSAPLVEGIEGNFYGTTYGGGASNLGVVFKITSAGKLTVLYNFDGTHGCSASNPLIQATDGNFYGTTMCGGKVDSGVVFKITGGGKLTVLHSLNGTSDGNVPLAGLVQATDGNFYGTASEGGNSANCLPDGCGTIFRVTPTGAFHVIYNFDSVTGLQPQVTLFQNTNGILYGETAYGGTGGSPLGCAVGNCGVLYSLNIGATAFVNLISTTAKVGKTVEILGQGLTGTTGVSFDGTAASFKVESDTYIRATVPDGATTGQVMVTTPGGTLNSSKMFRVAPQIKSFTPPSGPVGTTVTIARVSLTQTQGVGFGDKVPAHFTVNSDLSVTATVPSGAKTGPIGIRTKGGTAISTSIFTVTP